MLLERAVMTRIVNIEVVDPFSVIKYPKAGVSIATSSLNYPCANPVFHIVLSSKTRHAYAIVFGVRRDLRKADRTVEGQAANPRCTTGVSHESRAEHLKILLTSQSDLTTVT